MRRALLPIASALLLALAGCGSSSSSSGGVRGTELSYFPPSSPFVMSIETDPNSSAVQQGQALIGRFPIATFGESALMTKLEGLGIDYQSDIRPLFGNPVMLGAVGTSLSGSSLSGATRSEFLAVWVTKSAGKLSSLISKLHFSGAGTHAGATLYSSGATTFAVDGATLLLGGSSDTVTAALDRHSSGAGFSSATVARDLTDLPQNTLIEAFGDLSGVLSTPSAAQARNIPWVAALRGYGAAISATPSGLTFQYRLDTTGKPLSSSQLPLAAGSSAPSFAGADPITVALNDPAQVFDFAQQAEQSTSPSGYARYLSRQAAVRAKTGVDLDSLAKLLTGELIVASDTKTTVGRVAVTDPAVVETDLHKLMSQPRSVLAKTTSVSNLGGGFYALKQRKSTITVGVSGDELVAGRASVAQLRSFASAPTSTATGAQGSFAFRVALVQLIELALKRAPSKLAQTILSTIGDFSGWTAASTSGLTGSATLALK